MVFLRPIHSTVKHGFGAPWMLECPWRGTWEVLRLEGRVGSDYSGVSVAEAELAWSVPLRERERPLGVTFSAPSCISQACVVEQVSGGDGQAAWPPGAVEFRGGPSRFALPLGLPLSLLQIMTFIEHLLNTRL